MRFGRLAFALVLAAAQPVLAQTVPDQTAQPSQAPAQDPVQRFQAYVQSDGYKAMLAQIAVTGETISAPECKEHKPVAREIVAIFVPPTFGAGTHPVSGVWFDRVTMSRCGANIFQNVIFEAVGEEKRPRFNLMLPGSTNTIAPKQGKVLDDVLAELAKNKCSDQTQIIPVETKKGKETKPLKVNQKGQILEGAWKETWTFKACGKTVNATIDLAADGKGGVTHKVKL